MLQIKNLTYNAWGREFLDDASVSLPPGLDEDTIRSISRIKR